MGASPTLIDRHYGHHAREGREHAIRLLDGYADAKSTDVPSRGRPMDAGADDVADRDNGISARAEEPEAL